MQVAVESNLQVDVPLQLGHSAENRVFCHNNDCSLKLSIADAKVLNRGT
jgi:hypothetical protein